MARKSSFLLFFVILLSLTGCTARELEDRNFPLAMEVEYRNQEFLVEYALPNLGKETGQEKGGDDSKTKEEENVDQEQTGGKTLQEACDRFQENMEKFMDVGHMKCIILNVGVVEKPEALKEVLAYLENEPAFARTMQVFVYARKEEKSLIKETEGSVDSLGIYLENLMENHPKRLAVEPVSLGDILDFWHNQKKEIKIPLLTVQGGKPVANEIYSVMRVY